MHLVAIAGANGKMGQIAQTAINLLPNFKTIALITRADNLRESLITHRPKILIDVTLPEFAYEHAKTALELGVKPIIGTSGITEKEVRTLSSVNAKTGGIIAPNFSISAILMMHFAELSAPYFSHSEIIEEHHQAKLDSPSGTAIKTAELINCNNVHSIRRPGVIAKQTVLFANDTETLKLTQESLSRDSFIAGIQFACQQVLTITDLVYGLQQLIPGKNPENML